MNGYKKCIIIVCGRGKQEIWNIYLKKDKHKTSCCVCSGRWQSRGNRNKGSGYWDTHNTWTWTPSSPPEPPYTGQVSYSCLLQTSHQPFRLCVCVCQDITDTSSTQPAVYTEVSGCRPPGRKKWLSPPFFTSIWVPNVSSC